MIRVPPDISIVVASRNRLATIGQAVASVLDQTHPNVEVIVADCSSDGTRELLAGIDDPRLRVVFPPDLGMPVSRNAGLALATGEWVAFLDDDDVLRPTWAERLLSAVDEEVGVVLGGAENVDPQGRSQGVAHPSTADPVPPVFVAGSFLARRRGVVAVGGMLEGLPVAHNYELALRLGPWCRKDRLTMEVVDEPLVQILRRPAADRTMATPLQTYDGMRWVAVRHAEALAARPEHLAMLAANAGVAAARLGRWREARRWFARAVLLRPRDHRNVPRLLFTLVPWIGRRVWGDRSSFAPEATAALRGVRGMAALVEARGTSTDLLMLPFGYVEREVEPGGRDRSAGLSAAWPSVTRLLRCRPGASILVVGDEGSWRRIDAHGSPVATDGPAGEAPPADVVVLEEIERATDPYRMVGSAAALVRPGGALVVHTPDRRVVDGPGHLGPTSMATGRRLWDPDGFRLLLDGCGLVVDDLFPASPTLSGSVGQRSVRHRSRREMVAVTHVRVG